MSGLIGETGDGRDRLCLSVHQIDRRSCREEPERRSSPAERVRGYQEICRAEDASPRDVTWSQWE